MAHPFIISLANAIRHNLLHQRCPDDPALRLQINRNKFIGNPIFMVSQKYERCISRHLFCDRRGMVHKVRNQKSIILNNHSNFIIV